MKRLSAMENYELGEICWIASSLQEYCSQLGIEDGVIIRKLSGWGNDAVFSCCGKHFAITSIADGIGVVPVSF